MRGSWWFYYKDQTTNFNADISYNNNNNFNFKSCNCKAKLLGNTEADRSNGILKNGPFAVQLIIFGDHSKYQSLIVKLK